MLNQKSKYSKAKSGRKTNPYEAKMTFNKTQRYLKMCKTEQEALELQDKIRAELFAKLYAYETRPMTWLSPDRWQISAAGVNETN